MNSKSIKYIYDTHRNYDVIFNKSVISSLGLIADKVSLKCESLQVPAILFSTSMDKARVISKLTKECLLKIKDYGYKTTLRYTFYVQELGQSISFYINSKITGLDLYDSDKKELFLVSLDFTRMPPRIFIEILGEYIIKQETRHERAVERIDIPANKIEAFLFKDGNGKKCIITEISLFSAKILITGSRDIYKVGSVTMLIMKSKEIDGLGEMLGKIIRLEEIDSNEGIVSLIIQFDQEKVPPAYKLWVAECMQSAIT